METTYQGSCHCGNVKFEVTADIDHLRICDCSLCYQRGALNFRVEDTQLKRITPLEEMTLYQWHTKTAKDYFCPTCGILPFRRPRTAPDLWTINVRCLEGINVNDIPKEHLRGSELS